MIESIYVNIVSFIVISLISFILYILLLFIRRPKIEQKELFMDVLSSKFTQYGVDLSKIYNVIIEVDYGIKVISSNKPVKKYNDLKSKYNELIDSYSGAPGKIIGEMYTLGCIPPKQNILKRIITFVYLWWNVKSDNYYYTYFKLCKIFTVGV